MSSTGGRGRKKRAVGCPPDRDTCGHVSIHERTWYYITYPLLALFSVFRFLAVHFGILLSWLYEHTMAAKPEQRSDEQRDKECEDSGERIRNLHKQAFEYISVALKIDEDDKGV